MNPIQMQLQKELKELFDKFMKYLQSHHLESTLRIHKRTHNYYVEDSDLLMYPDSILFLYSRIMNRIHRWNILYGTKCQNCKNTENISMNGKIMGHFVKNEHDAPGNWICMEL